MNNETMNYALEARVEIAMYRLRLDLNPLGAWQNYERALEAASKAYDAGQADSAFLASEADLVKAGRLARESKCPLRSQFADWLAPLHEAVPSAGIGPWAEGVDKLSLYQLVEIGHDAADFTAAMRYQDLDQAASLALGDVWSESAKAVLARASEFSEAACNRTVVEQAFCGWRITNIGYAVMGAVAERVLAGTRAGRMPPGSMWFGGIFSQRSGGSI